MITAGGAFIMTYFASASSLQTNTQEENLRSQQKDYLPKTSHLCRDWKAIVVQQNGSRGALQTSSVPGRNKCEMQLWKWRRVFLGDRGWWPFFGDTELYKQRGASSPGTAVHQTSLTLQLSPQQNAKLSITDHKYLHESFIYFHTCEHLTIF